MMGSMIELWMGGQLESKEILDPELDYFVVVPENSEDLVWKRVETASLTEKCRDRVQSRFCEMIVWRIVCLIDGCVE